ncbi:DNA methyltransferase [Streptomyces sp. NPDC054933]
MKPYYADEQVTLHLGDCLDVLATLPDASIDAVVCDPPYGLADHHPSVIAKALAAWMGGDRAHVPDGKGFMGKDWDRFVPPPAVWDECLRVLKPGGHLIAFAGARTVDLMTLSIRLAGFEIRDGLNWIYGSGFPKGQDIAKSIDRHRGDHKRVLQVTAWLAAARDAAGWTSRRIDEVFGFNGMASHWTSIASKAASVPTLEQWARLRELLSFDDAEILPLVEELNGRKGAIGEAWDQREIIGQGHRVRRASDVQIAGLSIGAYDVTAPASVAAQRWQGWNTNLKPAHEPIVLARKSTGFDTTVANVLRHGTGALNIDGCRTTAGQDYRDKCASVVGLDSNRNGDAYGEWTGAREDSAHDAGRWPTNVLLGHGPNCVDGGDCQPGCPVAEMDRQSEGKRASKPSKSGSAGMPRDGVYGGGKGLPRDYVPISRDDAGGASRFFPVFRYEAKAPASERPRLADGTAHPTVKPLALMRWLVRLVTPPGGTVLEPFAGSGTTLEAAVIEGFRAIGVEQHQPYADLCVARLSKPIALGLFGEAS